MCEPTTVAMMAKGLSVAGAFTSAYGAYKKSSAEQAAYDYNAKVADNNRMMAEWQAQDALRRGQISVDRQKMKTAAVKSAQRASLASRGIDLGEGSALNILTDTDVMGEIDANTLATNAEREAWALRVQASNYGTQADFMRQRAADESPTASALTSLITGAGSVASTWYRFGKTKD